MANAKPQDEQTIRAEIKRYFYDAGDQGSAAALNSALTVLLKPGLTRQDRQRILDRLDVFTRADPAEYARNRDWATGAAIAAAGGAPPANVNEAAAAEGAMTAAGQAETASRVWQLGWAARGKYFNEQLGANLSATFPVIDRFADGTATSIKSINLNAATYKNPRSLINRLGNYINDLEEFEGITRSDDEVAKSDIKSRVLSLAIPKGGMTEQQKIVIESVRDWARTLRFPIEIIITEF